MSTEAVRSGVKFKRRYISATHPVTDKPVTPILKAAPPAQIEQPIASSEVNVLVINDSQDMAKEMSMQLTLALPGCSITYAPTIELAKWILGRRSINLVVSALYYLMVVSRG